MQSSHSPFIFLCLTGKLAWKMFNKMHRNKLNVRLGSLSTLTDVQVFYCSRVWKFIIVSLSINLVHWFKGNLFIVAYIYIFNCENWASWSDRPFNMGDAEDKVIPLLFTNSSTWVILHSCCKIYYVQQTMLLIIRLLVFCSCFQWDNLCLCLHKLKFSL
jgi:hypothetical protein